MLYIHLISDELRDLHSTDPFFRFAKWILTEKSILRSCKKILEDIKLVSVHWAFMAAIGSVWYEKDIHENGEITFQTYFDHDYGT